MELLRKNLKALGKKGHFVCVNGDLTGLCGECFSLYAYDITDIHFLEIFVCIFTDAVSCHINLDISLKVLNVAERSLTHNTLKH